MKTYNITKKNILFWKEDFFFSYYLSVAKLLWDGIFTYRLI